jgi:uncharacterized protein (UPF0218 family)
MIRITEEARAQLKKPLGEVYSDRDELKARSKDHRIISVGDVCTLVLLRSGIKPHLAVFDFKYKRMNLPKEDINKLKTEYPRPKTFQNPPGTLSEPLIKDAKDLIEEGGAVLIEGEEDLCALAFILALAENDIVVYGQPDEGIVVVDSSEETKRKVKKLIYPG